MYAFSVSLLQTAHNNMIYSAGSKNKLSNISKKFLGMGLVICA